MITYPLLSFPFLQEDPLRIVFEHQYDVVVQILPRAVDAVDVIGLVIDRILHEGIAERQLKAETVVDKDLVVVSRGHDDLLYPRLCDQLQLAGQDGLPRGYLRHAFRMLRSQDSHTGSEPGIQYQCFHRYVSLAGL